MIQQCKPVLLQQAQQEQRVSDAELEYLSLVFVKSSFQLASSSQRSYSSYLSLNSTIACLLIFCSDQPFFVAPFLVTVPTTGIYAFYTSSNINTYGLLYKPAFDLRFVYINLIDGDNDAFGNGQFLIRHILQANDTYVIVVTTSAPNTTGEFTLIAIGSAEVTLTPVTDFSKSFPHLLSFSISLLSSEKEDESITGTPYELIFYLTFCLL